MLVSDRLKIGHIYTRADLMRLLNTADATINTGIFRPKNLPSILLFITETKTSDRTQYVDHLDGDTLSWQGQSQGRKDRLIIDHEVNGLELLVFYRLNRYQHPGAGFVYEGPFRYIAHKGEKPATFELRRLTT